jgi:ABC-type enterochelin transport system substrate-binding protein
METIGKVFARAEEAEARVRELEEENERLKNQSMWGDYE